MNSFASRIKQLEAKINRLKYGGARSTSSLGIYEQVINIPSGVESCSIILSSNEPMLWTAYLAEPTTIPQSGIQFRCTTNQNFKDVVYIAATEGVLSGYKVMVRATSVFTYSIQ